MSDAMPRTITVHDCEDCPYTRYERYGEKLSTVCHHPDILPLADDNSGVVPVLAHQKHFPHWCPLPMATPPAP